MAKALKMPMHMQLFHLISLIVGRLPEVYYKPSLHLEANKLILTHKSAEEQATLTGLLETLLTANCHAFLLQCSVRAEREPEGSLCLCFQTNIEPTGFCVFGFL